MKTSTIIFKKYNLSIVVLFESELLKNNRHNYKQSNITKIKKMDQNN